MSDLSPKEYCDQTWDKVNEYIDGVEDESIVVGSYIKKFLKKYKKLANDHKYKFRTEKVDKVFQFFSFLKIEHKNEYKQFPLLPWQATFLSYIFGFYYSDDEEKRVVREAFLFIGRKNGKTAFAAAVQLFGMLGDGISNPQSLLLANTAQQASVSLNYAKDIIVHSKALRDRLQGQRSRIVFKNQQKQGFCQVFATIDPARLEGYSPSMAILDEIHGWDNNMVYNAVKTGIGARKNPLLCIITTAGNKNSGFCNEYLQYHKNVLDVKIDDDSVCGMIYQPDPDDELEDDSCWVKANPSLGFINSIDDLRQTFKQSQYSYADKFAFITKHLNIFWDTPDVWIPEEVLKPLFQKFDITKLYERECFVGMDLSKNTDLSSIVLLFPPNEEDKFFRAIPIFYMANRPDNIVRKNGKDLSPWINQKHIFKCESKVIDLDEIFNKLVELGKLFNIVSIQYDRYNAPQLVAKLMEHGFVCEPFDQVAKKFNAPLKTLESLIYNNQIIFYNNPCYLWNFGNVVLYIDPNANIKIVKNKQNDSVDAIVSTGMAIGGFIESKYGQEIMGLQQYLNNT